MSDDTSASFLVRHEFLIRRLHSLSGLIPVGAYMVVHLLVNASVLNSPATFQTAVYQIHSLGSLLPLVEWTFIFLPILFHAILGVVIIRGGLPNNSSYRYVSNFRYTLQRATGMIAFVFIAWHVFHMHGWFHFEWWHVNVSEPFGGAQFAPYRAASTVGEAMRGFFYPAFYALGVLSCVFHLANGLWTMGITWGVWVTPRAQARASWVCLVLGLGLAVVGLSALAGAVGVGGKEAVERARQVEDKMFEAKVRSGELDPESELVKSKRRDAHESHQDSNQQPGEKQAGGDKATSGVLSSSQSAR
ncbi:MAG: succinate dehydrogenase cytochrome b558 subunit [Pirellulaceae bacterium]|nr:succinate dehydrogenase cytochrome b558 subunit [Pirellulaceae bacterium]